MRNKLNAVRNSVGALLREYKAVASKNRVGIGFFVAVLALTPIVQQHYNKLLVESYNEETWSKVRAEVLQTCRENIKLNEFVSSSEEYFVQQSQGLSHYRLGFTCGDKNITYSHSLSMPHHWTWGTFVEYVPLAGTDAKLLRELDEIWSKTSQYKSEFNEYHRLRYLKKEKVGSAHARLKQELEAMKREFK